MKKEVFEDKINSGKLRFRHGDIIGVEFGVYDQDVLDIREFRQAMVVGQYKGVNRESVIRIIRTGSLFL